MDQKPSLYAHIDQIAGDMSDAVCGDYFRIIEKCQRAKQGGNRYIKLKAKAIVLAVVHDGLQDLWKKGWALDDETHAAKIDPQELEAIQQEIDDLEKEFLHCLKSQKAPGCGLTQVPIDPRQLRPGSN
jgi:hypothetical protein